MKMIIALVFLMTICSVAFAEWTGSRVGNFQYWNNSETGQNVTCNQVGSFTYCD